jgi:DMSO/TMAO reductase YedYZ molybdopterin-dependent catalytic subunit
VPLLRPWPAITVGVLGVGSAVAAGELVAGFVGADASPLIAVGSAAINLTPGWLKNFATSTFGTADKLVLLSGMGLVLLLVAIGAGLASRRTATVGTVVALVFGTVAMVAVINPPDLSQLGLLAPLASLLAGVIVFRWLHRLALTWADAETAGRRAVLGGMDDPAAGNRRRFLVTSAGVAVGAGLVGFAGEALASRSDVQGSMDAIGPLVPARVVTPVVPGADFAADGTPTFLTNNADFYRIDTALTVPLLRTQDWSLRIHGMVDREITLHYNDIRNRPLVEAPVTLTCVSNPVSGPYISTSNFIGVPLRELLMEAGVHESAQQLLSTSVDGFTVGTPVDTLLDENRGAMLAIGMNRQPLPVEHGFPARMVVPGLYGYVSATKWVVDMELTTWDGAQAYWVPRGYSQQAPIKTEARIDRPAQSATVAAGRVVVAGIAWAQSRGIEKVEVQVDNGPWQEAQLSTEVSKNTWRMWRTTFTLPAGSHLVQARATDDTGQTQTSDQQDEIPDGATGYPSVGFSCR